eukprot:m.64690 g.64690  ORF g.64690 m.64690 type:complete len:62 (+) comp13503_c0_seq6:124-309(+)
MQACRITCLWLVSKIKGYTVPPETEKHVRSMHSAEFMNAADAYIASVLYQPHALVLSLKRS